MEKRKLRQPTTAKRGALIYWSYFLCFILYRNVLIVCKSNSSFVNDWNMLLTICNDCQLLLWIHTGTNFWVERYSSRYSLCHRRHPHRNEDKGWMQICWWHVKCCRCFFSWNRYKVLLQVLLTEFLWSPIGPVQIIFQPKKTLLQSIGNGPSDAKASFWRSIRNVVSNESDDTPHSEVDSSVSYGMTPGSGFGSDQEIIEATNVILWLDSTMPWAARFSMIYVVVIRCLTSGMSVHLHNFKICTISCVWSNCSTVKKWFVVPINTFVLLYWLQPYDSL
jgi:hypothetical protein